jgi:S1-C subfamily serine protease
MNRLLLLLLLLLTGPALRAQDALSVLRKLDEGFSAVFDKVAPSVVVIEAMKPDEEEDAPPSKFQAPADEPGATPTPKERGPRLPEAPSQSEGSGFVIRSDGCILTNLHVVSGAEKIEVRTYSGRRFKAKLLASDERTDVAVLKVDATGLPAIEWGDSDDLRVGQLVCAIGAPYSQAYSFTAGWVSGKGRADLRARSSPKVLFEDYIQTDAVINPGNSGGPLFDVEGRVIGMNTLVHGLNRGMAFAIPSNLLRDTSTQLIDTGRVRRPWIGIRVTNLDDNPSLREQLPNLDNGVVITTIEARGSAFNSDLQPGDVITALDGAALRGAHDLIRLVQRKKIGAQISLDLLRKSQPTKATVTIGELPDEITRASVPRPALLPLPGAVPGVKLGDASPSGAKVLELAPGGLASAAELQVGDIITEVESEPVRTAAAADSALKAALAKPSRKGILVNLLRAGKKSWAVIERPRQ